MEDFTLPKCITYSKPIGRRDVGRPRKRWNSPEGLCLEVNYGGGDDDDTVKGQCLCNKCRQFLGQDSNRVTFEYI
jgi:hypothetical protein